MPRFQGYRVGGLFQEEGVHGITPPAPSYFNRGQWSVIVLLLLLVSPAWGEGDSPVPKEKRKKITLTADRLEYVHGEENYRAEGNVNLTHDTLDLHANILQFNNKTKQLLGEGGITLKQGGNILSARKVEYQLATDQGILWDGRLFIEPVRYTLTGKQIVRQSQERYHLQGASFTACDNPNDPDWRISARAIDVTLNRYLTAKYVVCYVNEWPILALPYVWYPVNTTRQSGLLVPDVGYSRSHGLRYNQDLFWAIAPDQDMTLSVDFRDRKGSGGGVEYRYAFSETTGIFQAYAFHDRETQVDRTRFDYRHTQRFSDSWVLNMNLHEVSPQRSFSDLSDSISDRARPVLESSADFTYTGNNVLAYVLAYDAQDLVHPENSFRKLPEIGWRLIEYPLGPFYYDAGITHTAYQRDLEWNRLDLSQKISLPLTIVNGLTLTPWAGIRPVRYSRTKLADQPFHRNITATGANLRAGWTKSAFRFSQEILYEEIQIEDRLDILQRIECEVTGEQCRRIPMEDRTDIIPVDDLDRIHNRRSVTVALNPAIGTFLDLRLSETYQVDSPADNPYSDIRGEVMFRPASFLSLKTEGFYNADHKRVTAVNTDLNLDIADRLKMAIGRYYVQEGVIPVKGDPFNPLYLGDNREVPRNNVIFGQGWIRLGREFRLAGQVFYDEDDNRATETHYGVLYLKQCVSVMLAYQGLPAGRDEFFFSVHLKGLGPLIPKRFAYLFDF